MFLLYITFCIKSNINKRMNRDHEILSNSLTPVMWPPGCMGAFFMRFIEDSNFKINEGRIQENLEWENWDRLFQYLYSDTGYPYYQSYLNPHLGLLKEKYKGDDYYRAFMYVMYQLTESAVSKYGKFSDHHLWPIKLSESFLLELAESPPLFDISKLKFFHLKMHLASKEKDIVKNINWQSILFCHFPENKTWLADILLYYKKHYYKIHNNCFTEINKETRDWNSIIDRLARKNELEQRFDYTEYNDTRYVNIDMYDLIFNENTSPLLTVYPNFMLTDSQHTLLKLVREDIIYICNVFGLDHTINLLPGDNTDCLKTKQILGIYNAVKNIGPEGPI